ncbi:MAG: hypothetical protein ABSC94_06500 [Polyangiaceae bacterium]|jgi:hypothetical protein
MREPALVLGFVVSCSSGVRADSGADATMQVAGGQFVRGPMPEGSASGPTVAQISLMNSNIWAGLVNDPLEGALGPTATAAAVGLLGDVGYWILVAGTPSVTTPNDPSFSGTLEFSDGIIVGSYTLVARAVDQNGNFGLPKTQILAAEVSPLNPPATGDLVVTLAWDTESNLDLHVVDPAGLDIYWGNPSSEPPFSFDQAEGGSYGYVDYDSNANCVIDGLRREDAVWPNRPPSGEYTVRVDTPSLCGQPIANWKVRVVLDGNQIAESSGVAVDADTMGSHGAGSGVLALQFNVQ